MSTPGSVHRREDRAVSVLFRMSRDDKQLLRQRADEAGLTIQAYLEEVALGRRAEPRRGGRPFQKQEVLPLTG